MCKFYISALVGIIIERLDNMHGVTMKIQLYKMFCRILVITRGTLLVAQLVQALR